jgi:hypothetical protein
MDPDLNKYDLEHVTTAHPKMSADELQAIYRKAWDLYYTPEHVETVIRRARRSGYPTAGMMVKLLSFYGCVRFERIHPLEGGLIRCKYRRDRRPGLPIEAPGLFHLKYLWEMLDKYTRFFRMTLQYRRIRRRVEREDASAGGEDLALRPVQEDELESLQLYTATEAARATAHKVLVHRVARRSATAIS